MADQGRVEAEQGRAVETDSKTGFARRGGWWVVGQSGLMAGVVVGGVLQGGQWLSGMASVLGWLLFSIGGLVGGLGVIHLGRARTAFPRPLEGTRLVTSGIYGSVRHPLYLSVIAASVGWGLIWGSGLALVLAAVLAVFLDAKARREEAWLKEVYPEYTIYAQQVKRLVPGVY